LPLFLQKESGFQGKALRISTGEKAFCTLFTEERFQKVVGSGNARLSLSGLCKSRARVSVQHFRVQYVQV
jgi:hypothetical protein